MFVATLFANFSSTKLILFFIVFSVISALCAYMLTHADEEAKRLLEADRLWRRKKKDDAIQFVKIKNRMVKGYWGFLIVSLLFAIAFAIGLLQRLWLDTL